MERRFKHLRTLLIILITMTSSSVYSQACYAAWDAGNGQYCAGETASYGGKNWNAKWCNTNAPNTGQWNDEGACTAGLITSEAATVIATTTATFNGTVTGDGGSALTDRGFIWGVSSADVTSSTIGSLSGASALINEGGVTVASYTYNAADLCRNTTLYYKAWYSNGSGEEYGNSNIAFITLNLAATFNTTQDGAISADATWGGCSAPALAALPSDVNNINHTTTSGSISVMNGNTLTIKSGAVLTVTGDVTVNNGTVIVEAGGQLIISGNFSGESNAGSLSNAGIMTVGGTLNAGIASFPITNTGTLTTAIFTSVGQVTNSGPFTATTSILYNNTTGGQEWTNTAGTVTSPSVTIGAGTAPMIAMDGGTLQCNGDLDITGGGDISSGAGSAINITGDWNQSGDADAEMNGAVSITGNLDAISAATLTFNGTTTIGGNLNGTGAGVITVGSTMEITGELSLTNSAIMNGTGTVGWGTEDINNQTSNGRLICNDASIYDTHPGGRSPDPPGNPLNLTTCAPGTLPVQLISFSASKASGLLNVNWVTGSEINSDYFEVLGSADGVTWEVIQVVAGAGNSNEVNEYEVIEDQANTVLLKYVRLKQVDFDGAEALFRIVALEASIDKLDISVFPNPVNNVLHVGVSALEKGKYKILIVNAQGQTVESMSVLIRSGEDTVNLLIEGLKNGLYSVVIINATEQRFSVRFIKN